MKNEESKLDVYDAVSISVGTTLVVIGLCLIILDSYGLINLRG